MLYVKGEGLAKSARNLCIVAACVDWTFKDKDWIKGILEKAENKAVSSDDYVCLAKAVMEHLGNEEWSDELFNKADLVSIQEDYIGYYDRLYSEMY